MFTKKSLGKDQGVNIRHRAKQTVEFLQDENRVRDERKKAKKNKDKYVGVSKNMVATSGSSRYMDDYDEDYSTSSNVYKDDKEDAIKTEQSPELIRKTTISPQPPKSVESTPTKAKPKIYVSKKVDLGAAADYAKQHQDAKQSKSNENLSTMTTQSNMLFDLIQTSDQGEQKTATQTQVTDLFDSLTIQSSTPPTSSVIPATEQFADFADFTNFKDDAQVKTNQESTNKQVDDDDFADFASFNSLPAQTATVQLSPQPVIKPATSTQDDLLDLVMGSNNLFSNSNISTGPSSLPQMNTNSSLAGLSSSNSLFTTNSSTSSLNPSSAGAAFQADTFLTPLTPSKPTTLNLKAADQLKDDESTKQSPTACAILNNKKNTWGGLLTQNLKIDLDNLLQNKKEKPKPSMNQLAANRVTTNQPFAHQGKCV